MKRRVFVDQTGNSISLLETPRRVVSLVPSQTELLYDLGLDQEIVGITKFCVHPEHWLQKKQIVGGTKNFWFDVIDQINPDLIVGNKEENYESGIRELQSKYPVWMSDIVTYPGALDMIKSISKIMNKEDKGFALMANIQSAFNQLQPAKMQRALYLIWCNPWMGIGSRTFIHTMLEKAGFINVLENYERYPELTREHIQKLEPEVVLLSSEPFPFKEEHAAEVKAMLPKADVKLVDGEMFSWYGSRMLKAPDYFKSL